MEDSVEGLLHEADWIQDWEDDIEAIDMKPIECASPSFADRRKPNPRAGNVRQSISFDTKDSSPLLASSGEIDVSFLSCGKSTPSPNGMSAFRSALIIHHLPHSTRFSPYMYCHTHTKL